MYFYNICISTNNVFLQDMFFYNFYKLWLSLSYVFLQYMYFYKIMYFFMICITSRYVYFYASCYCTTQVLPQVMYLTKKFFLFRISPRYILLHIMYFYNICISTNNVFLLIMYFFKVCTSTNHVIKHVLPQVMY